MQNLALKPDVTFDELLTAARNKFGAIKFNTVKVGGAEIEVAQVADMPAYLDKLIDKARGGKKIELPLWAKVWPSCLVLGLYLDKFKAVENAKILEVGAGGGVCGLVAAKRGFDVVISDIDPDAQLFCRLNALRNNLDDKVTIAEVDFTTTDLDCKFDYIVGCEVLYKDEVQKPLVDFISNHLGDNPEAEVLMAMDKKRGGRIFFNEAKDSYSLMRQEVPFAGNEDEGKSVISLIRMRRK